MVDRALLDELLRGVDQAAFALAGDATEHGRSAALAHLGDVRALLSAAALQEAAAPRGGPGVSKGDEASGGPALARRVRLDGDPRPAAAARSFTRSTCEAWGVSGAASSTAVDLASELVSNAARHAGGPIELALELSDPRMLVTVWDASEDPPRVMPYRPGITEQGIGLRLVDQLSESWGWVAEPHGKRVWASVALSHTPGSGPAHQVTHARRTSAGARPVEARPPALTGTSESRRLTGSSRSPSLRGGVPPRPEGAPHLDRRADAGPLPRQRRVDASAPGHGALPRPGGR
jgi:anti-sigma regulatory factor (Ser/Thr protein kinase)